MDKVKAFLVKALAGLKVLLGLVPKRILIAAIGALLAGIARKYPGVPLPSPEEILIGIGVLIGADSLREMGSGKALVEPKVVSEDVAKAAKDLLPK